MKKNLLILAFAAPLLAFGQATFYVGEGAKVAVKKSTLIHTNGAFKVVDGAEGVVNEGNVNVQGPFAGNTDGSKFVNKFENGTQYGQLIIKNGENVTGKMTGEFRFATYKQFPYQHMAFPYVEYSAQEAVEQSKVTGETWLSGTNYKQRYKSPIFAANNVDALIDHIKNEDKGKALVPTVGYSINQLFSNLKDDTSDGMRRKAFVGKPNNAEKVEDQAEHNLSGKTNFETNIYNEHYGSYIVDVTRTMPENWQSYLAHGDVEAGDYGKNLYTLGNPYTSNIDISNAADYNISHVIVYYANDYGGVNEGGSISNKYLESFTNVTVYPLASPSNPVAGGSISEFNTIVPAPENLGDDIKYIRPYQTFEVRTKTGSKLTYKFEDAIKTFELKDKNAFHFSKGNRNTDTGFYQVGLDLYQGEENTGARLYIVASDYYQPKGKSDYEAYNVWSSKDEIGVYSVQENADGTIAEELSDQKVYINGINATDYVAKPVHIVFQGKDNTPFTFKVRLNNSLLNSKNTFYFEDKKEGKVMEITPEFEYTFVEPTLNKDRFVIYWNGVPQTMATQDIASSQTQVYKDGVDHKVRFAVEFNRADVYVYDLNGRLVSAEKSIDTASDYTLPYLAKGNVFVVKVVGDNGVVTTQKIIK